MRDERTRREKLQAVAATGSGTADAEREKALEVLAADAPRPVKTFGYTLERLWRTRAGPWAMVVLNSVGFRLAYVRLPDELVARLARASDDQSPSDRIAAQDAVPISVHGGVTFGPEPYPAEQLDNGDGVPDGSWVGWDYGHFTDVPEPERWRAATGGHDWPIGGRLWTTDQVSAECEEAAADLEAAATRQATGGT